jgi:hypothetical protein
MGLGSWVSSKLPAWVRRQPLLTPEVREELKQEYQIPIRDSFHTVRGWRDLGIVYEVAGGDPYKDPVVTRAIHTFDPDVIPMTVRWTFMEAAPSTRTETFVRHALGRYIASPHYEHAPLPVVLPPLYVGPVPNQIDLIWSGELFGMKDPRGGDIPGDFLPWDSRLVAFYQRAYSWHKNHTVAEMKEHFVSEPLKKAAKVSAARRAEELYKLNDIRAYVSKLLSRLGEPELKAYFMGGKFQKRPRAATIVVPGQPREAPRPTQPTLPRSLYGQGAKPAVNK